MPPPRADFVCLAAKCQQDGAATIYELPVTATRCPVCGSKRLRRLFNAVNVGSADARAHAKIVETSSIPAQMDAAKERKDFTMRGEELARAGGSAGGALNVALASDPQRISRNLAMPVLKMLTPPRPKYER